MRSRRRAELVAKFVQSLAEQRRRQTTVDDAGPDEVDPDGRELERRLLQTLRIAAREDDLRSLGACPSGCLESYPGAAPDYDVGLAKGGGFAKVGLVQYYFRRRVAGARRPA